MSVVLLTHFRRIFSHGELVSRVQEYDFECYDCIVDTHIKNLRRKISALLPGQEVVCSAYGVGYKLQVPLYMKLPNGHVYTW
jgi:two-component system response regulator BaeR